MEQQIIIKSGQRTKLFKDVFVDENQFYIEIAAYLQNMVSLGSITEEQYKTIYKWLIGRYMHRPINFLIEEQFKQEMANIISIKAPIIFKKIDILKKIIALSEDDINKRYSEVRNSASTDGKRNHSTDDIDGFDYVDSQDYMTVLENKFTSLQNYANNLMFNDREEFIKGFNHLFKNVFGPDYSPYFVIEEEEEDDDNE